MFSIKKLWKQFVTFSAGERGERMQRGQALSEYWPTIPAGVMIMLSASLIVGFVTGALHQAVTGLTTSGLECEEETSEVSEGPTYAQAGCHSVELIAKNYDPGTDRTTITYRVTSCDKPSISHWLLALPEAVKNLILATSEPYSWGKDPKTGLTGIKFDTGYEVSYRGEDSGIVLVAYPLPPPPDTASRDVIITLAGYFDFQVTYLGVKAGTEIYYSTISAPVAASTAEESETCEE